MLQDGKFGHGFTSASVTQAFAGSIDGIDEGQRFSPKRIVAAAVIGGTSSSITGGKFSKGAVTGAFSRAFNDEVHDAHVKRYEALQAKGPGTVFATVDDAAVDGVLYASERPQVDEDGLFLEQGGDIYPVEGGYTYNDLQVGGPNSVDVNFRKDAVAWFHTHPPGGAGGRSMDKSNRYWSRGDRYKNDDLSEAMNRPVTAYVGGTDGAVRSFTNGGPTRGVEVRARGFFEWTKQR